MSRLHPIKVNKLLSKYKLASDIIFVFNSIPCNCYSNYLITEDIDTVINTIYYSSNIEYEDELTIDNTKVIVKDIVRNGKKVLSSVYKGRSEMLVENMFYAYNDMECLLDKSVLTVMDIYEIHYDMMLNIPNIRTPGKPRCFKATINGREDCVKFTSPHLIESELCELINNINEFLIDLTSGYPYSNEEKLDKILDSRCNL